MEQTTIRLCVPLEAVSLNSILGQAVYLNDKCYVIKHIELSETDSSMVNLLGVLKTELKKNHQRPTSFPKGTAPNAPD